MSTLRVNTLQNTSGVEVYTAKAWVNFNGTGTVAIRASGNVSSVTDNGTGDYTLNFTTALASANYCVSGAGRQGDSATAGTMRVVCICAVGNLADAMTTSSLRVSTQSSNGNADDIQVVTVAVHL